MIFKLKNYRREIKVKLIYLSFFQQTSISVRFLRKFDGWVLQIQHGSSSVQARQGQYNSHTW